jgi:hypothetical protein
MSFFLLDEIPGAHYDHHVGFFSYFILNVTAVFPASLARLWVAMGRRRNMPRFTSRSPPAMHHTGEPKALLIRYFGVS